MVGTQVPLWFPRHLATRAFGVVSPRPRFRFQYRICVFFSPRCTLSLREGRWHRSCTVMSRTVPRSKWSTRRMAPPTPPWTPRSTRSFTSIPWKLRRHVWFWAHPVLAPRKQNHLVWDESQLPAEWCDWKIAGSWLLTLLSARCWTGTLCCLFVWCANGVIKGCRGYELWNAGYFTRGGRDYN